jgi:hypothetical protein
MSVSISRRASGYLALSQHIPCSRVGCTAHGALGTAVGLRFCYHDWRRHALVEIVQRWFPCCMSTRQAVRRSYLGEWMVFIRQASEEEIEQVLIVMAA